MARCNPDWGSLSNRRIDTGPVAAGAAVSRARPIARQRRRTIKELSTGTPTTTKKVTAATVSGFMASYLDLGDTPHHEEADGLHDEARPQEHGCQGRLHHGREVAGAHEREHEGECHRAEPHANRRPAMLRRQRAGMAQDLEALADDFGQPVEDLGEVSARAALDEDRGAEEPDAIGRHALGQPRERLAGIHAELRLFEDPGELGPDG